MARTKKPAKAGGSPSKGSPTKSSFSSTSPTRPNTALFALVFASCSAAGLWLMRVETGIKDIPVKFIDQIENARYHNGVPLREHYTGIEAIDFFRYLVTAFIAGPLGWDEGVRVQQLHFLVQFFAVVAVWNVEGCRGRNAWKTFSFTALFALFYQTIGGACIVPLYYLSFALSTSKDSYFTSGRAVSLPYAKGMLFSVVVGYLVPTLAMYTPGMSAETAQLLTLIWQPAPAFVNLLLLISSLVLRPSSSTGVTSTRTPADVKHLRRVYNAAAIVAGLNHVITMYICLTSTHPQLSLSYVFIPQRATWADSTTAGLHYIFQIDWWGCFVPTLIWAWMSVYDVHRMLLGRAGVTTSQLVSWAFYIVGMSVAFGPGGMLALVWSWREDRLVMIESGVRGTLKKPKTA
ncbi:hypothetical protein F5Y16DRAFT_244516 [Xylariaceae sp. FL0255]|nr:hypothetical protein F5Y16DRAFT_244516 [Xylariaceae sp. FL0255]